MTSKEKTRIKQLRSKGLGSTRIAKELTLSVNTVKSYLRRNLPKETSLISSGPDDGCCKQCGVALEHTARRKPKVFCSDACRLRWWNSNRESVTKRSSVTKVCPVCKKRFDSYEKENRKYCSHSCYINARFGGNKSNDKRTV